ncbi:Scr1 family TA system antitoxin-like transcriptional regulator [Streptomyces sp. NPDC052396]|uniref:helix-turn-helix domain-containing protein n=1 Tax=Streptomyces sp. NPDC052396 TaxID=3365689 RepID=UPI0037D40C51
MHEGPEGAQDGPEFYGSEVRFAREHAGKTQPQLAEATGYKVPYVSKVENGHTLGSEHFAEGCDRFFGTSGYFLRLHRRISDAGHPEWFVPYVKLERQASIIEDYSTTFIMGMLQTPAYAEATFRAANPQASGVKIKAWVESRLARHSVIERDAPPRLWVILHEATLRMIVGDTATMGEQLEYLLTEVQRPNVTLQVLPFAAKTPASHLPLTLLTSADGTTALYEEIRHHARVDESAAAVAEAQDVYNRLRACALSPELSMALISTTLKELTHEQDPRPLPRDMGEVESQRRHRRTVLGVHPRVRGFRRHPRP